MTPAPLPTEEIDATDALLGRARQFILAMVEIVRSRMITPRGLAAKHCRTLLAEFVAPAEAALRRAILIIAAGLPAPELRARAPTAAPSPSRDGPITRAAPEHPLPVFRLSEPVPQAAAPRPVPARDPVASTTRAAPYPDAAREALLRRLEALEIAAADPIRAAERWRRRQPLPVPAASGEPQLPLDFFALPQTWLHLPGDLVVLLIELNAAALNACLPDTS